MFNTKDLQTEHTYIQKIGRVKLRPWAGFYGTSVSNPFFGPGRARRGHKDGSLGATRGRIQSYSLSLHSINIGPNFIYVGRSWLQLQKFWQILLLCFSYAFIVQKGFLHDLFWKANIIGIIVVIVSYMNSPNTSFIFKIHKVWITNFLPKVWVMATWHFLLGRCWHSVLTLGVDTYLKDIRFGRCQHPVSALGVDTYQKRYCFGRCQHLPKVVLLW